MTETATDIQPVARVGDTIQHSSFWAEVGGAIVGNLVAAAPTLLSGLAGPLGIAARVGYLLYEAGSMAKDIWDSLNDKEVEPSWAEKARAATTDFLNDCFASPDGEIALGAKTVFINDKPVAVAGLENSVTCHNHDLKQIAEGSETVFVEDYPIARKNDRTECGATIAEGAADVIAGSGKTMVCDIAPEFSRAERAIIAAVEVGVPPSKQTLRKGLGAIRLGLSELPKIMKKTNIADTVSKAIKKAEITSYPPFKLSKKHNTPELKREFERQLKDQQDAINKMKVKDWLKNREEFKSRNKLEHSKNVNIERKNIAKKYGRNNMINIENQECQKKMRVIEQIAI